MSVWVYFWFSCFPQCQSMTIGGLINCPRMSVWMYLHSVLWLSDIPSTHVFLLHTRSLWEKLQIHCDPTMTLPWIKCLLKASEWKSVAWDVVFLSTQWLKSYCSVVTVIGDGTEDRGHMVCSFVNLVADHFIFFSSISVTQGKRLQSCPDLYLLLRLLKKNCGSGKIW